MVGRVWPRRHFDISCKPITTMIVWSPPPPRYSSPGLARRGSCWAWCHVRRTAALVTVITSTQSADRRLITSGLFNYPVRRQDAPDIAPQFTAHYAILCFSSFLVVSLCFIFLIFRFSPNFYSFWLTISMRSFYSLKSAQQLEYINLKRLIFTQIIITVIPNSNQKMLYLTM